MKNSEYWKNRFGQLEEAQHNLMQADKAEIYRQYARTQQILNGQIALWYQRFADNNNITLAEVKQYVQGEALAELKWNVHEYIQYGKDNAVSGNWKKQLENASAKFHITKLEALKIQTQNSLETLFAQIDGTVTDGMTDIYTSGYYHTAYELQKGFGVGFDIASIDQSQLVKLISKPWSPDKYNFSERIWGYKNQLISTVHNILTENIRQGSDPSKAIGQIAVAMKNSRFNAGRLVMTEGAYFSSLSQRDCFEKLGVEEYEIVATLDDRTSEKCINLDGKVYKLADYRVADTAPPFHCYCRTTTAPHFSYDLKLGERAARDGDGRTYYIPDDMKYRDWEKAFVNGDKSKFDLKVIEGTEHYSYPKKTGAATPPKTTKNQPKTIDKSGKDAIIKVEEKPFNIVKLSLRTDDGLKKAEEWQNNYYDLNKEASFARVDNDNIYKYSGGWYDGINSTLRGGNAQERFKKRYGDDYDPDKYFKVADGISEELSKFKLDKPLELKRMVRNVDYITGSTSSLEDMKNAIGKTYKEKGFTSATVFQDTALPFGDVALEIVADPKYTRGAYIYKISEHPAEFEFLIDKNTTFKVIDAGEREVEETDFRGKVHKRMEKYMRLQVIEND